MITIRVIDKATNELRWKEKHPSKKCADKELEHMQRNHFNPLFFYFEISDTDKGECRHE